jgi:hypothetical protein
MDNNVEENRSQVTTTKSNFTIFSFITGTGI